MKLNPRRAIQRALRHARPGKTGDMRVLAQCYREWLRSGACNLCHTPEPEPIVEHWHRDGHHGPIRGLWCKRCNALEGKMKKKILELCRPEPVSHIEYVLDEYERRTTDPLKLKIFHAYRPFFRLDAIADAQATGKDVDTCMNVDSSTSLCGYYNLLPR